MSNPTYTHCHACDRGGNGNAKDKCACGWRVKHASDKGCYLGSPIVGEIKAAATERPTRKQKSKERYVRYLEFGECFRSFRDFLSWDSSPERSWNRKATP